MVINGKRRHKGGAKPLPSDPLWSPPPPPPALSASTSGSAGDPSSPNDPASMATPAGENAAFVRPGKKGDVSGRKKKTGVRAIAGDKGGRGLREYSLKVCEKVESKGRTTYNEVADELVAEMAEHSNMASADEAPQDVEKNIRRRVYDALNVLMAIDIISKDRKQIQWKGLPWTCQNDVDELKADQIRLKKVVEKKTAYLQEFEDQYVGLQTLIQRNEQLSGSVGASSGGVALPFILVQTHPHATVEVEISEDMQLVHFDLNSNPFELHDDSYVLKAMRFYGREQKNKGDHEPSSNGGDCPSPMGIDQHHMTQFMRRPNVGPQISPPLPGILKPPRAKHNY